MTSADDVRRVARALPRAYEVEVRGRAKFRVGQIVFVAFSHDETQTGFGFPRGERDGLVAGDPETFYLPGTADLRFQWVCARLPRLGEEEMRELVTDAWRMCTPKMLHDLPEQPAPTAAAWDLIDRRDWSGVRPLLDPHLEWYDGDLAIRGRDRVIAHLAEHPRPKPPRDVEVRDGMIRLWRR